MRNGEKLQRTLAKALRTADELRSAVEAGAGPAVLARRAWAAHLAAGEAWGEARWAGAIPRALTHAPVSPASPPGER